MKGFEKKEEKAPKVKHDWLTIEEEDVCQRCGVSKSKVTSSECTVQGM